MKTDVTRVLVPAPAAVPVTGGRDTPVGLAIGPRPPAGVCSRAGPGAASTKV